MKERILTGWTLIRVFYLITGSYIIAQGLMEKQWFAMVFGAYFAAMGLFGFGCAGGNCYGGKCIPAPQQKSTSASSETDFEEINTK